MFGLTRSWAIAMASWQVLLAERGLLLFPVLSGVCTTLAVVAFTVPACVVTSATSGRQQTGEATHLVLLFLFYLVTSFITLFFNTALVGVAIERLRGGDPRVGDGFRIATEQLPSILAFSAISATVGVILRLVEERFEVVGSIVSSILGGAWSVVTFLVVPVMVVERQGAFAAIPRSGALLRTTWGAQIAGNLGIGVLVFLAALLGLVPIGLGFAAGVGPAILLGIAVAVVWWVGVAIIASALGQIYRAAVYLYAASDNVPSQFDGWMLREAFKSR